MRVGRLVSLGFTLAGCLHAVPQDAHTGRDGDAAGATPMVSTADEAHAAGVVTYPGGDRVDWMRLEVPAGSDLELRLTWRPPRPGLAVAMQVYDRRGVLVFDTGARPSRRGVTATTVRVPDAGGPLLIAVYAPARGDAGAYTLHATWRPWVELDGARPIAPPPPLPAVPITSAPCTPTTYDPANPACVAVCPDPPRPDLACDRWPPVRGRDHADH